VVAFAIPPEPLAVLPVAVDVTLWGLVDELAVPPTPPVLVAVVAADELVAELPEVVACPLVLLTVVPVFAAAAVWEPAALTAPDESSSAPQALSTSGRITPNTRQLSASERGEWLSMAERAGGYGDAAE
jgi:hypothetical protein